MSAQMPGLVLVVSLATDSYFAPGRTFAVAFDHPDLPLPLNLPPLAAPSGSYVIPPDVAVKVSWYLGSSWTTLPVQATYRALWPLGLKPSMPPTTATDALSLGLPLDPVQAETFPNEPFFSSMYPGPAEGPSIGFRTYLQPGMYERTLTPQPPFDTAFPPEVRVVAVNEGGSFETDPLTALDVARGTESNPQSPPKFDITRAGGLDGWTAYLRETTTGRTLSNVRPLSGTLSKGILLATNHVKPTMNDALTNAELVVAPPLGTPIPTGVFHPVVPTSGPPIPSLPAQLTYVPLPPPSMVSGSIATQAGMPVSADLTFEAIRITRCQDAACTPPGQLTTFNFEFFASASARVDPGTGTSVYSVVLPPGQYQVVVRPLDATSAVTTEFFVVDPQMGSLTGRDISVYDRQPVRGSAVVADGRALSGATVEAIAVSCFGASGSSTSGSCLPPGGQTITLVDGSFTLNLDPGGYLLRVRPAEGTRLPWVTSPLQVNLVPAVVPPLTIPAPMDVSHLLLDPLGNPGNPIIRAVVRVFSLPPPAGASGTAPPGPLATQALELGRAITDVSGRYEMYLAPPAQ